MPYIYIICSIYKLFYTLFFIIKTVLLITSETVQRWRCVIPKPCFFTPLFHTYYCVIVHSSVYFYKHNSLGHPSNCKTDIIPILWMRKLMLTPFSFRPGIICLNGVTQLMLLCRSKDFSIFAVNLLYENLLCSMVELDHWGQS